MINNFTGVYIAFIIACLYWLFASKLSDFILNKKELDENCSSNKIYDNFTRESDEVKKAHCNDELEKHSKDKTTFMIVMGLLGLFAGIYGTTNGNTTYFVPTLGLALGGGIIMINFVIENWNTISDGYRLMLITGSLGILIYGGSKINNY
jgi:hypothetical protein